MLYTKAIAWTLITLVLAYACFSVWSFVLAKFFESHIAFTAIALGTYLSFLTLLTGVASFSKFVLPIFDVKARDISEEDC